MDGPHVLVTALGLWIPRSCEPDPIGLVPMVSEICG
jgi:hypothetical protein